MFSAQITCRKFCEGGRRVVVLGGFRPRGFCPGDLCPTPISTDQGHRKEDEHPADAALEYSSI